MASLRSQNGNAAHVYDLRSHGANVRSESHNLNLSNETIKIQIVQWYANVKLKGVLAMAKALMLIITIVCIVYIVYNFIKDKTNP